MNISTTCKMTEADYDRERAKIARSKAEARNEAGVRWEQQLALLFYRSGWTQVELAKKEKKEQNWVTCRIRFGKFLNFISNELNAENIPNNLNESCFRRYWARTEKGSGNERIRFIRALEMMRAETTLSRSHAKLNLGPAIRKEFGDGKWHPIEAIVQAADASHDEVERTLTLMHEKGTYETKTERKRVGGSFHYRIFPQDRASVSVKELKEKLTPIIKELMIQGRTNAATVSISTVLHNAVRLQKLLDEWLDKDD